MLCTYPAGYIHIVLYLLNLISTLQLDLLNLEMSIFSRRVSALFILLYHAWFVEIPVFNPNSVDLG